MRKIVFLSFLLLAVVLRVSAVEQNVVAVYQQDGQKAIFWWVTNTCLKSEVLIKPSNKSKMCRTPSWL